MKQNPIERALKKMNFTQRETEAFNKIKDMGRTYQKLGIQQNLKSFIELEINKLATDTNED